MRGRVGRWVRGSLGFEWLECVERAGLIRIVGMVRRSFGNIVWRRFKSAVLGCDGWHSEPVVDKVYFTIKGLQLDRGLVG